MSTEEPPEESSDWQRIWDARVAALTPALGPVSDMVGHAMIPFDLGGTADVIDFPKHLEGWTYVTAELTGTDVGQKRSSLGNYELMICTRTENPMAAGLISNLARYTCDAVLEPGETMDISRYFGDRTIRALLFVHPKGGPISFTVEGQTCGLLLCVGITKAELNFKHANGWEALLEKLVGAGVFPFTEPDRRSVVEGSKGFFGRLFGG